MMLPVAPALEPVELSAVFLVMHARAIIVGVEPVEPLAFFQPFEARVRLVLTNALVMLAPFAVNAAAE